jgi:hypothetical protein
MSYQINQNKVRDFIVAAGISVPTSICKEAFDDKDIRTLCYGLIEEEFKELMDAYKIADWKEVLDALGDLEYVVHYASVRFGLPVGTNISLSLPIKDLFSNLEDHIQSKLSTNTFDTINQSLQCILDTLRTLAIRFSMDFDEAFTRIHDSNMSKFCSTEDLAIRTVTNYKNTQTRYDSPNYRQSCDLWAIYNESTGKILKSIEYYPVDLTGLYDEKKCNEINININEY